MPRKSKGTPEGIDKLITMREIIGEEEYARYWRRLNNARNEKGAFEQEAERIKEELEQRAVKPVQIEPVPEQLPNRLVSSRKQAEKIKREFGGRIVRRNKKGQFSKRGRKFQVINTR